VKPRYLAIEGPIGVGKSSLAKLLAEKMGAEYLSDTDAVNPWLEAFYRDPAANALHTQLHFLVSRIESLERQQPQAAEGSRRGVRPLIADFMLDKDPLFAELVLDEREWRLYTALYERLAVTLPENSVTPDLVIYLQAPVEHLIKRIEQRGIAWEQRIDSAYLDGLSRLYEKLFHNYSASPLLIVNSESVDFTQDTGAVDRLLAATRLTRVRASSERSRRPATTWLFSTGSWKPAAPGLMFCTGCVPRSPAMSR